MSDMESQFEAAQDATPGSPQEGGPKWHQRFRRRRSTDIAEQTAPQGFRDQVTAWYYRLPLVRRVALWTLVIILFAALPAMLPYITADSQYWTLILGAPTLRLRGDYLAIVTLGFGEIVRITANNLQSIEGGPRGVLNLPHPEIHIGSFHYLFGLQNEPYYWLLLAVIVIWIFFLRRINDSRIGRSWAAIREDEVAAASMGVPTVRLK